MNLKITMVGICCRFGIPLILLLLFASGNAQTTHQVAVTNNVFTPDEITITEGDEVVWTNTQGSHNVNGNRSVFPNNPESFGNGVAQGWTFSHVFTKPGDYDYQCDPHIQFNMFGKVHVLEGAPDTLTIKFSGMTPHLGEMLKLYVRDVSTSLTVDSLLLAEITEDAFNLESYAIEVGSSYLIDFYADHNQNAQYDAPPVDHSWRIELNNVSGNETIEFVHNTSFTDIGSSGTTNIQGIGYKTTLTAYPNPTRGEIRVTSDGSISSIELYSASGARLRIYDGQNRSRVEVSLKEYDAGLFFIKVKETSGREIVQKIFKY